jgi:hypothetical protein
MDDDHEKAKDAGERESALGEFSRTVSGFHLISSRYDAILNRAMIRSDYSPSFATKPACDKTTHRLQYIEATRQLPWRGGRYKMSHVLLFNMRSLRLNAILLLINMILLEGYRISC